METWLKISLILATFGFLKEFRPSEPYLNEFLTGPWKNFTIDVIDNDIFPIGTYSYLIWSFFVFIITDLCRYKPLIFLLGVSGMVIWSLFPWGHGLFAMQILEVFYGLANALEVAYYTYMYAKVPKEYFSQVTSHARAGTLIGRFIASCTAQITISLGILNYRDLNFLTLGALTLATIWSLFLPPVETSIYFHHIPLDDEHFDYNDKLKKGLKLIWSHFITSYSNWYVIKWSIWWALATCGYTQVTVYIQNLWGEILGENEHQIYNGGVEALLTLLSALSALLAGILNVDWSKYGELTLGICTAIAGGSLLVSTILSNIWYSYIAYILFGSLYQFLITISTAEVAKKLVADSYGLIFGINTLIALILQTILTLVVITYMQTQIFEQYIIYGVLHIVLGGFFVIIGTVNLYVKCGVNEDERQTNSSYGAVLDHKHLNGI